MSAVPQLPYAGQPSGTTRWLPTLSEFIIEAYSRIQVRGAALSVDLVIDARRSMNFILQEWSNRGVNLWKVAEEGYPDICIPMQPGVSTYDIPRDTVNLLDSYIRIFTPSAQTFDIGIPLVPLVRQSEGPTVTNLANLGNALVPLVTQGSEPIYLLTDDGQIILDGAGNPIVVTPGQPSTPLVSQPYGDPLVEQPGSGALSCVAGSPVITLNWPGSPHLIRPGATLKWGCPISIGGIVITGQSIVIAVSGAEIQFNATIPALETQTNQGATPLFWTTAGSPSIGCILPGHGLTAGMTFSVPIATTVGGIVLSGTYIVGAVTSSYEFFFSVGSPLAVYLFASPGVPLLSDQGVPLIADWSGTGAPSLNDAEFENFGRINVSSTYIETLIAPIFTQIFGDPLVEQPGNTMSVEAGSQYVTLRWPAHCLIPGSPIFWLAPISIGGVAVFGFSVVVEVIDWQTLTFMLPKPAIETQVNQGQTPLFWTSPNTPLVGVNLPGHGLCQHEIFNVGVPTIVGEGISRGVAVPGLELFGGYPIVFVENSYNFFINPTGLPVQFLLTDSGAPLLDDSGIPLVADMSSKFASTVLFENNGQPQVATQQTGMQWTDIFLWPISRNDYAFQPNKEEQGRPTTYWFNRAIYPTITVWPVPPAPQAISGFKLEPQLLLTDTGQPIIGPDGQPLVTGNVIQVPAYLLPPLAFPQPPSPLGPGPFFAFIGYRMREIEDANPMNGQGLDAPRRFFQAFSSALTAAVAEKYKPEVFTAKLQLSEIYWDRAASEDREKVEFSIQPDFSGFLS